MWDFEQRDRHGSLQKGRGQLNLLVKKPSDKHKKTGFLIRFLCRCLPYIVVIYIFIDCFKSFCGVLKMGWRLLGMQQGLRLAFWKRLNHTAESRLYLQGHWEGLLSKEGVARGIWSGLCVFKDIAQPSRLFSFSGFQSCCLGQLIQAIPLLLSNSRFLKS